MKEIRFRGKRLDNGEWIKAFTVISLDDNADFFMLQKGEVCFVHNDERGNIDSLIGRIYKIDPATLGRYTGAVDKNGVKIFEGDIIDMTGEDWSTCCRNGYKSPICVVEWDDDFSGYAPFVRYDSDCGMYVNASGCKVIGNIHDNPELLKETT